jgi:hypothetical protein
MLVQRNQAFSEKIQQLALPLAPLVSLSSGEKHDSFPKTLLNFHLLTGEQLDDLAHFYHQRTPSPWSQHYPHPIHTTWRNNACLEDKRRRFGKFIGLRGYESPLNLLTEDDIFEEIRRVREQAAEEEEFRGKGRWY